jgi:pimeloyl-ACP methyl ester carboxylesterase
MVSISTPSHPVHVIAFDYRGFGQSTGTPTEEGLITDAVAVINFLTSPPLSIPHSRIVIAGESLGTAVAAGVVERIALGSSSSSGEASASEPFAGVFLFAPFRNVQELLDSYSFMGLLPPLFAPLMAQPRLKNYMISTIVDRWDTASRLARLTGISSPGDEKLITSISYKRPFDLTIFHAVNDYDIPWREGQRTWEAAVGGNEASALGTFVADSVSEDGVAQVKVWERYGSDGKAVARVVWQRLRYGGKSNEFHFSGTAADVPSLTPFSVHLGHNQIASLPLAAVAVKRAFERATAEN